MVSAPPHTSGAYRRRTSARDGSLCEYGFTSRSVIAPSDTDTPEAIAVLAAFAENGAVVAHGRPGSSSKNPGGGSGSAGSVDAPRGEQAACRVPCLPSFQVETP